MADQARIIIGGGIVGCSILNHLDRAGCRDALLLERAELASGATWHAAGNTHTQSPIPNLSKLQAVGLELYAGLAEEVGQEVGAHRCDGFFLAQSPERMEEFKFLVGKFRALGIEYDLATPQEIKAKHPPIETDGAVVGYATSGGDVWRAGRSLAVGWIPAALAAPRTALEVEILGERRPAEVVADPIYDPTNARHLT